MPECYICGAAIRRGAGYRREVQTGTSARFYVGSRRGSSFGMSYGVRTVCATCAKIVDAEREGNLLRGILYSVAWLGSAYVGFFVVPKTNLEPPWGGLWVIFFALGIPVLIVRQILESARKRRIIDDAIGGVPDADKADGGRAAGVADSALQPGEKVAGWAARIAPRFASEDLSEVDVASGLLNMARDTPPRVGESIEEWQARATGFLEEARCLMGDEAPALEARKQGETIAAWAERIAPDRRDDGETAEEASKNFLNIARRVPPMVGEIFGDWITRVKATDLDGHSSSSCIQSGESLDAWAARIRPMVAESESENEAVIDHVAGIAKEHPPMEGETAAHWATRLQTILEKS